MTQLVVTDFTPALQPLADIIGCEWLLHLVQLYEAGRLYVPKQMGERHAITAAIGWEMAERLAYHYGGCTIEFPRVATIYRRARNREIAAQRYQDRDVLAARYGVSKRRIFQVLQMQRAQVKVCP